MLGVSQQMLQEPEFGLAKVDVNAVAFHPVPLEVHLDAGISEWDAAGCFPGNAISIPSARSKVLKQLCRRDRSDKTRVDAGFQKVCVLALSARLNQRDQG
jgi:hypothetical protein